MEACARPAPDHPDAPSRAGLWVAAAGGVALVASGVLFAVASHYRGVADGQAGDAYERNVDRMNRAQKAGFLVGIAGLGAVIGGLVYHF